LNSRHSIEHIQSRERSQLQCGARVVVVVVAAGLRMACREHLTLPVVVVAVVNTQLEQSQSPLDKS